MSVKGAVERTESSRGALGAVGEAGADPAGEGVELAARGAALHESERHAPAATAEERIPRVHGQEVNVEVEHCGERLAAFLDAGVRNLVVKFTCAPDEQLDQQAAFAEILPALRR